MKGLFQVHVLKRFLPADRWLDGKAYVVMMTRVASCFQAGYLDTAPASGVHPTSTKTFDDVARLLQQGKLKEAKVTLRNQHWAVDHPSRGDLWSLLAVHHRSKGSSRCQDPEPGSPSLCPGLPSFVDPLYCEDYCLNTEGRRCCERLLHWVSLAYPFVNYCPLLYPVTALFLHYIPEDKAYECICCLLEGTKVRHLSQTRLMHHTSARALRLLTRRLCKKPYAYLQQLLGQEDDVETFFRSWELWIFRALPFCHLVRAMDCFLLEGVRALYRIAMALIMLFAQELAKARKEAAMDVGVLIDRMVSFCKEVAVSVDGLLKTAYGIQGLSGKLLNEQLMKAEASMRSGSPGHLPPLPQCRSLPVQQERYERLRSMSTAVVPSLRLEGLDMEQLGMLWSWLPARIAMQEPRLVFSTSEHGTSLTSFFLHCDSWEPTVLLIRTTQNERLGAYCSTRWSERHKERSYFGTGETFVFTFSMSGVPEGRHFPWVGVRSSVDVSPSARLFLSADQNMIQVGGGGGFALYLDSSLEHGRTEHCDTFNNPPLVDKGDFVVAVLEVLGFG